jgi:membrane-anchored glycerophosphoryl diester phosphodiesterase (GDPDase)
MTKRDFFRILIKIFGLYLLILVLFSAIASNISLLVYQIDTSFFLAVLAVLASILISVGLFLALIFKPDYIIDILKLDKGFDEEQINLGNLTSESIFKFSIIVIGGFLIIDNVPSLLFDIVNAFKLKATFTNIEGRNVDYFQITVAVINIVIGFLFITNYKSITNFLTKTNN